MTDEQFDRQHEAWLREMIEQSATVVASLPDPDTTQPWTPRKQDADLPATLLRQVPDGAHRKMPATDHKN